MDTATHRHYQRHFADGETTADLASNAATKAITRAGLPDIDPIIVATHHSG